MRKNDQGFHTGFVKLVIPQLKGSGDIAMSLASFPSSIRPSIRRKHFHVHSNLTNAYSYLLCN